MMKNELQIFENSEFGSVRTVGIDGKPYFVASDVAKALGYAKPQNAIATHCRGALKRGIGVQTGIKADGTPAFQTVEMSVIPEGDIYRLVIKSQLPTAERFESWVFDEVLPSLRETGFYEMPKAKPRPESLASVNNAVKILTPLLQQAGCTAEIQLLTARTLYEKAGISIPLEIKADKHYVDTVHIARHVGLYYQSSGKPADKAVNEIIRRLNLPESMYTETWESKGNWQGAVRKYDEAVIGMVSRWYCENGYPRDIEYTQVDGQKKYYHVMWRDKEVA